MITNKWKKNSIQINGKTTKLRRCSYLQNRCELDESLFDVRVRMWRFQENVGNERICVVWFFHRVQEFVETGRYVVDLPIKNTCQTERTFKKEYTYNVSWENKNYFSIVSNDLMHDLWGVGRNFIRIVLASPFIPTTATTLMSKK